MLSTLIKQEDIADLPIDYLREWKCWKLTDEVLATFGKKGFEAPIIRRRVVRYALQVPEAAAFPLRVRARVLYRKFSATYSLAACKTAAASAPAMATCQ